MKESTTIIESHRRLDAISREIKVEVQAAEDDFQSAVAHAIRAGELLTEAKEKVAHGGWLPWLKANCPLSERTARNYMRLARNRQRVADLPSVRQAVALLTEEAPTAPTRPPSSFETNAYATLVAKAALKLIIERAEALLDDAPHLDRLQRCLEVAEGHQQASRALGRELLGWSEDELQRDSGSLDEMLFARAGATCLALAALDPDDRGYEDAYDECIRSLAAVSESGASR